MPTIDIALPAHNCARWIDGFVESVIAQDSEDWRIVARDDASTDTTETRLESWRKGLSGRMVVVENPDQRNLGMVGNYNAVLAETTAPWVMFADPDDLWKPGKIQNTVRAMREAESAAGSGTPVLVYSDAEVVDSDLRPVAASFWRWSRMNPELAGIFHRLIVESPVLSSTVMVNRALLELAMPLTGAASCPDWWPALVASAFGRIVRLPEATILYRRHPSNDSLDPFSSTIWGAVVRFFRDAAAPRRRTKRLLRQFAPQAAAFARRFGDRLNSGDFAALEAAARLPDVDGFTRRWAVVRHRLWFASPLKNAGLILLM